MRGSVRLGSVLGAAWERMMARAGPLVVMAVLLVVVRAVVDAFTPGNADSPFADVTSLALGMALSGVALVIALALLAPLNAGFAMAGLAAARGAMPSGAHLAMGWRRYPAVLGLTVLYGLVTLVVLAPVVVVIAMMGPLVDLRSVPPMAWLVVAFAGFLAVVFVPVGVYLAVRWAFAFLFVVDGGEDMIGALRRSWHLSGGSPWSVFGLVALAVVANGAVAVLGAGGVTLLVPAVLFEVLVLAWGAVAVGVLYDRLGGGPREVVSPRLGDWEPVLAEDVMRARPSYM